VHGTLANTWSLKGNELTMTVTVPGNTTAEIVIPSDGAGSVKESGRPLHTAPGILGVTRDPGRNATVVTVGSGRYSFTAPRQTTS
jgi:alpha-L-rhamnosidase